MTRPVTLVMCSHSLLPPRSDSVREAIEPREIERLLDCRLEPWVSTRRRDATGQWYRVEPELRAEIVRIRGPRPNDTGLPNRSGVTQDWETGVRQWTFRCAPCRINLEPSATTLGRVLDALYPVLPADGNDERTVELHTLAVLLSKVDLLP